LFANGMRLIDESRTLNSYTNRWVWSHTTPKHNLFSHLLYKDDLLSHDWSNFTHKYTFEHFW
jgi:hypothetical protein